MKKHRKKIITGIIFLAILIGFFGVVSFSPKIADMFQKAVAQNEGEGSILASSEEIEETEAETTETNENILTLEDTTYAVSAGVDDNYANLNTVASVDQLTATDYAISTYDDWKKLKELSQYSSLEGITFHIYYLNNSSTPVIWNLTSEYIGEGIGSSSYPFAGTLKPYFDVMTIQTNVTLFHSLSSKAVIGNEKNGANPLKIEYAITGSTSTEGGLAKNYVLCDANVNLADHYKNIKILGNIQSTGTVGGLFGTVTKNIDTATIVLSKNASIDLSGVTEFKGSIVGGLFGEVSGNITMNLESMPSVATKVIADDPHTSNGTDPLGYTVCAGGLIGKMSNGAMLVRTAVPDENNSTEYLVIGNVVDGEGISGGLVGAVTGNSEVNVSYIQKDSECVTVDKNIYEPYISAKYICGGFIGVADSSKIEVSHLVLNADVKAYYSGDSGLYGAYDPLAYPRDGRCYTAAGGVIGRYFTTSGDTDSYLKISDITTGNTQRCEGTINENGQIQYGKVDDYTQKIMVYANASCATLNTGGGIIGACNGNHVQITNINFDNDFYNVSLIYAIAKTNTHYVSNTSNESVSGAVAGSLCGYDILVSNITFNFIRKSSTGIYSNSLGGYYVGNIAGLVGSDRGKNISTKIKVTDIKVTNNYIHKAKKYHGGLFGYVAKGAVICLDGKIDISKVPFKHIYQGANGDWIGTDCVLLAPKEKFGGYRGFIAGYAENSLIYFEYDSEVKRSIKYDDSGKLVSNMDGVNFDADNGAYYLYCIDDIGNAGSVLQNIKREDDSKVIQYKNDYGSEITGKLTVDNSENYQISTLADALILAIAGQTYDVDTGELIFAKSCFKDQDCNISAILSANYVITGNLNLGDANIHSFLRNDSTYGFSGSMEGEGGINPVITLNSVSKHTDGGLYPSLASGATFKNLTIDGKLWYHEGIYSTTRTRSEGGSGSIAAKAKGNCTFEGITINTSIKGDMYNNITEEYVDGSFISDKMYSHGGLIGEYQLEGGHLEVSKCNFSPVITHIRSSNFVGGMIGRVETSLNAEGNIGTINISSSTVGTKITADNINFMIGMNSYTNKAHARTAGLISFIGNSYNNVANIKTSFNSYPTNIEDKTYAKIEMSGISIENSTLDLEAANNIYVNMSGGLLGYAWCNVETKMNNINVNSCTINSLGSVGGLITFIAGKFDVSNVTLSNLTMKCVDGDRPFSGLLFGNGQLAYVTLDQSTYKINTGTSDEENGINISGYSSFDEIMGINVQTNIQGTDNATFFTQKIKEEYKNGGILNIINSKFSSFDSDFYESYTNKVCATSNKYTRYYYNLFINEKWKFDECHASIKVDTPEKLMTWHVGNYADEKLSRFFVSYFANNSYYRSQCKNVNISVSLDMKGYSLYPTCIDNVLVKGGESVGIKLYGEEISNFEYGLYESKKSKIYRNNELKGIYKEVQPNEECTQHYLMHSALLYYVNTATISDLTISGSIANNASSTTPSSTGSLIGGCATGNITISNIVFDGLRVSHYESLSGEYSVCGLMLGNVGYKNYTNIASKVVIDNITTKGYDNLENKPVAGALITRVGSDTAKNIQISFKNMKLDSKSSSKVFKYAAFMYSFNYSSDSKDNKSYGIYTFDYADTVDVNNKEDNHNVTYGKEISDGIHYNDKYLYEIDESKGDANPLKTAIEEAGKGTYIKYVHEKMGIFVNPKNGNITEGCGTYEDPYIIENPAQLLTLFCYLSGEHDVYRSFLKPGEKEEAAWQVVPIGGNADGYECTYESNETEHKTAIYAKDSTFPTVDDMRTAYYMIKNDIDLANTGDANYTMLLKRFAGLGSYKYPFSGVIVGAKITETSGVTYPTITLPSNDSTNYTHFGLIEYMQGAVVKDINIKNEKVTVAGSVGGVAAVILGGDNIIDNVTVGIKATLYDASVAGGYVGTIENGSLILRNVKDKYVVDGCEFGLYSDTGVTDYYTSPTQTMTIADENMKVGLLVGTVEDGFILYDDDGFGTDKKVINIGDMPVTKGREEKIPLVNGFQIINGASLDAASGEGSKRIYVEELTDAAGYDINIYNTEQLEIMALALNSDSLSVYVDTNHSDPNLRLSHSSGYDYTARCRKATYEYVGAENAKETADCVFAKDYDDGKKVGTFGYLYPYLCYNYMRVGEGSDTFDDSKRYETFMKTINPVPDTTDSNIIEKYVSKLNKADDNVSQYTTSYKLRTSNYVYDLSVYENSFRGFGALYSKTYSDFRANFDGKGCSIKIKMDRNWDSNIYITGMFNSLIYDNRNGEALEIKNFIIIDSVFQNILNKENLSTVDEANARKGAACGSATGAVAGEVQGKWGIKDITFKRNDANLTTSYEGVLFAALTEEEFDREMVCGVRGYMNVGGLIGRINVTEQADSYGNEEVHMASNNIEIKRCFVQGISAEKAVNIIGGTDAFAVGGLVGSIGANINTYGYNTDKRGYFYFGNVLFGGCTVENVNILAKNSGFLGGFAGTVGYRPKIYWRSVGYVEVDKSSIIDSNKVTIDYLNNVKQVKILSTEYESLEKVMDKYSAGGVFGQIEELAYKKLETYDGKTNYNSEIDSEKAFSSIEDVTVENVVINNQSDNTYINEKNVIDYTLQGNTGGIGGLIGYLNCRKMEIENVQVKNSQIGFYDYEDNDEANNQYALTHVGGLIGLSSSNGEFSETAQSFYTNMLSVKGAEVTNCKIVNKQTQADAGGFIGYLSTEIVTITKKDDDRISVTNNVISAGGESGNAGGVIGRNCTSNYSPVQDSGTDTLSAKKYIEYLDVAKNTITAKATYGDAGGIVGEFTTNSVNAYENRLTLRAVQVGGLEGDSENNSSSNTIIASEYVGGLCGYIKGMTYLRYKEYTKVGSESGGNTLIGRVAGGLYGKNEQWTNGYELRELFETDIVEVINNKIIACSDTKEATVCGGIAGVRSYHKSSSPYMATYTIKKNVIIATGKLSNGTINNISCGGMYGMVQYSSGPYVQYFDNMVLEDNSIGYYPAFQKNIKTFDYAITHFTSTDLSLDYTSQDVYLLKWDSTSSKYTFDNWRNFDINESNVGDFACRIGSYIGNYKDVNMHCVFLRPTLFYSENVGSIPAVDVASYAYSQTATSSDYGYSYPYDYKEKCHFVYLDDYLSEGIVDISSADSGIKPVLDKSVLMLHDVIETKAEDGTTTISEEVYETEYFFGNIADIVSRYSEVKKTTLSADATDMGRITATYNFLTSKRLDITMGGTENENLICASPDKDDYFSKTYIKANTENYNGVSVIEMDGQSAQYIGDYVAAILTNGGGVYPGYTSNTFNKLLNISCLNAYIDPDGKICAIENGKVAETEHGESSITTVGENLLSAVNRPFDQEIETTDGKKYYTITLLRYTYNSYDYTGKKKKETIYIPVFVKKKVTMNSYLSILSGEEYSLVEACTNGRKDDVVVSHDSVYTVYSEFVYDDVRKEENFSNLIINKTLKFETQTSDEYNVKAGTKYTLVDVQTGKEYYYTVPEDKAVSEIPFSEFKDSSGAVYVQRSIGSSESGITIEKENYTSIGYYGGEIGKDSFEGISGIERFFIVVEPSGADNNTSYRLSITTEVVNENGVDKEEFVRKIESEGTNITQIPGPLIGFEGVMKNQSGDLEGTEDVTWISGAIAKDKTLEVDGRIRVSLVPQDGTNGDRKGSPYWIYKAAKKTIDSANAGKYLEIGVTLIDNETQKEVQWPKGTNVSINGGPQKPLQGNSVIYAYKDNEEQFSFDTLTHNIANGEWYYYDINEGKTEGEVNYQWITKNEEEWYYQYYDQDGNLQSQKTGINSLIEEYISVSNQCHLEFDFSVADIKDYVGKDYTVKINLYRSSDPDFPLEEVGTAVLDGSIREYWKVIQAEGNVDLAAAITPNDLLELGINLYGDTQDTYEISFTNKIDFTNMISTNETAAKKDVEECAEKNYMVVYRIYKKTPNSNGNGYTYELVNLDDNESPFSLYDITTQESPIQISLISAGSDENEAQTMENAFVTTKTFTADEININTTDSPQYVVTWQMKLTVDSSNITNEDLANYKVEATYLPYEGDKPTSDSESTLKDYFIFTIAKLKTDF